MNSGRTEQLSPGKCWDLNFIQILSQKRLEAGSNDEKYIQPS